MSKRQNKKSDDAKISKLNIIAALVNLIIALINLLTEMLRRL